VNVAPVTLEGGVVRLEPLALEHHRQLSEVALDPELWRWGLTMMRTAEDLKSYIETALAERAVGRSMPFAVIEKSGGRAIGSTRYANIELAQRRLEIGWTWYGRAWQRTACNTECKLLLLGHAFEVLGCQRVELKTDVLNTRSRTAILRLGAKEEGVFRKHGVAWDGRVRDSVYYSIVDDEWPEVKRRLEGHLSNPRRPATI